MKLSSSHHTLLIVIFILGILCGSIGKCQSDSQDKNRDASLPDDKKRVVKPELEQKVRDLIAATWKAHNEEPHQISMMQLLGFLEKKLSKEDKQRLIKRGNIQFKKLHENGGTFSNKGRFITLKVKHEDGTDIEIDVPEEIRGIYVSSEKECVFSFEKSYMVRICKWENIAGPIWARLGTDVVKVEASFKKLVVDLLDTDDLYYVFEEEEKE